ncbi:MAG TPA: DUF885 domain-containing protein, partial [Thermoanaerobaculia bacterium]|nr:DUF885 domain-containing protein [Thermoanaerobaculia bacterium]
MKTAATIIMMTAFAIPAFSHEPVRTNQMQEETEKLHRLFEAQWEWAMQEFPEYATMLGDLRYNERLAEQSLEAIERRRAKAREALAEIREIDRSKLSPADQLNYDLYVTQLEDQIAGFVYPGETVPINQMGGVHQDLARLAAMAPRRTPQQVDDFITRLRQVPEVVDQTIELMKKGLDAGVTPPRVTLRQVADLIAAQTPEDPTTSPIYQLYFAQLPEAIPAEEREALQKRGRQVIENQVIPAYGKLHRFWVEEYYPGTRESIGLSALPNGYEWYEYNVRQRTTTNLAPEEIHQIGLKEVERIRAEMEAIREETGFEGDLQEFFEFLRTDPQFFFTEKEDLLRAYRDIAKRVDGELPRLFRTMPRLPYGIEPVPEYSERTQTTAYYNPGSIEAGRSGTFFANTYNLASRPKWEMEALTIHEAVPGHHLQIALAQELGDVPNFRRYGFGYTAFVEGWGLYSESLGPELGMYQDPYSKFGQLTYEMWRAIRLVVDTGMHAKGWSRQQAIDYFTENAGKSEHD